MKKLMVLVSGLLIVSLAFIAVGCGSSGTTSAATTTTTAASTTTTTTNTTTTTSAGTAALSGQVVVSSDDLALVGASAFTIIEPKFRTMANAGLSGATVSLYHLGTDGTETNLGLTATTDATGNYSFTAVPVQATCIVKAIANKTVGADSLVISSLKVLDSTAPATANLAPETTVATKLFDTKIKNKYSSVVINKNSLENAFDLVVDDIENLVQTQGKLTLPSNLDSKSNQMENAALAIAEDPNLNAKKAFLKIDLENAKENGQGAKVINKMINADDGSISSNVAQVLGTAYASDTNKTLSETITALDQAYSSTALNAGTVTSAWQNEINNVFTQIASLGAGLTDDLITSPAFFVFSEAPTLSSTTDLDMGQVVALKQFVGQQYASGDTFKGVKFVGALGLSAGQTGITTAAACFKDIDIYYGSYGGVWKIGGTVIITVPESLQTAGTTPEAVNLLYQGTTVATFAIRSISIKTTISS